MAEQHPPTATRVEVGIWLGGDHSVCVFRREGTPDEAKSLCWREDDVRFPAKCWFTGRDLQSYPEPHAVHVPMANLLLARSSLVPGDQALVAVLRDFLPCKLVANAEAEYALRAPLCPPVSLDVGIRHTLRDMLESLRDATGGPVEVARLAIALPLNFTDRQVRRVADLARQELGAPPLMLPEPLATAAFALEGALPEPTLVVHAGGAAVSCCLLGTSPCEGELVALAHLCDLHCGGHALDWHIACGLRRIHALEVEDADMPALVRAVAPAKVRLATGEARTGECSVAFHSAARGRLVSLPLTTRLLADLAQPVVDRVLECIRETLRRAPHGRRGAPMLVVVIGGHARLPMLLKALAREFPGRLVTIPAGKSNATGALRMVAGLARGVPPTRLAAVSGLWLSVSTMVGGSGGLQAVVPQFVRLSPPGAPLEQTLHLREAGLREAQLDVFAHDGAAQAPEAARFLGSLRLPLGGDHPAGTPVRVVFRYTPFAGDLVVQARVASEPVAEVTLDAHRPWLPAPRNVLEQMRVSAKAEHNAALLQSLLACGRHNFQALESAANGEPLLWPLQSLRDALLKVVTPLDMQRLPTPTVVAGVDLVTARLTPAKAERLLAAAADPRAELQPDSDDEEQAPPSPPADARHRPGVGVPQAAPCTYVAVPAGRKPVAFVDARVLVDYCRAGDIQRHRVAPTAPADTGGPDPDAWKSDPGQLVVVPRPGARELLRGLRTRFDVRIYTSEALLRDLPDVPDSDAPFVLVPDHAEHAVPTLGAAASDPRRFLIFRPAGVSPHWSACLENVVLVDPFPWFPRAGRPGLQAAGMVPHPARGGSAVLSGVVAELSRRLEGEADVRRALHGMRGAVLEGCCVAVAPGAGQDAVLAAALAEQLGATRAGDEADGPKPTHVLVGSAAPQAPGAVVPQWVDACAVLCRRAPEAEYVPGATVRALTHAELCRSQLGAAPSEKIAGKSSSKAAASKLAADAAAPSAAAAAGSAVQPCIEALAEVAAAVLSGAGAKAPLPAIASHGAPRPHTSPPAPNRKPVSKSASAAAATAKAPHAPSMPAATAAAKAPSMPVPGHAPRAAPPAKGVNVAARTATAATAAKPAPVHGGGTGGVQHRKIKQLPLLGSRPGKLRKTSDVGDVSAAAGREGGAMKMGASSGAPASPAADRQRPPNAGAPTSASKRR